MSNICIKCEIDIPDNCQVCPVCGADNSTRAQCPCNGCTSRYDTCHATCKRYTTWSKRRNEMLINKYNANKANFLGTRRKTKR